MSIRYPAEWKKLVTKELKGKDIETLTWHSHEGIDVQPVFTHKDWVAPAEEIPGILIYIIYNRRW